MTDFKLPREFAEKWIEALESGEYKQGNGMLAIDTELGEKQYCCLGVACRIVNPEIKLTNIGYPNDIRGEMIGLLPDVLLDSSLSFTLPKVLSLLNDNQIGVLSSFIRDCDLKVILDENKLYRQGAYSFKEIAQFIRDNVEFTDYDKEN